MSTTLEVSKSVPHPSYKLIDNPPNPKRTMEALRSLGYDSYAAIEDLIDNSVDAGAKKIAVNIAEVKGDIHITLVDDGCGMDEATLDEALRLGSDISHEDED